MSEFRHEELRDLLPDYVAGALDTSTTAEIAGHIASCGACPRELEVLRAVRAVRPAAVRIDVARIVASLPPASVLGSSQDRLRHTVNDGLPATATSPKLTLVSTPPSFDRPVRRQSRRAFAFVGGSAWKAAATIVVLFGGSWSVYRSQRVDERAPSGIVRDSLRPSNTGDSGVAAAESAANVALRGTEPGDAGSTAVRPAGASNASAISVGNLGDYSDEELATMLTRLEKWDGAAAVDPLPTVPLLPVTQQGASE